MSNSFEKLLRKLSLPGRASAPLDHQRRPGIDLALLEQAWQKGDPGSSRITLGGAAGNRGEAFGGQVVKVEGGDEQRSERIRHTRSEERRSLLGGPCLRGMPRSRWAASARSHACALAAASAAVLVVIGGRSVCGDEDESRNAEGDIP